jgi:hypothetical protein
MQTLALAQRLSTPARRQALLYSQIGFNRSTVGPLVVARSFSTGNHRPTNKSNGIPQVHRRNSSSQPQPNKEQGDQGKHEGQVNLSNYFDLMFGSLVVETR